MKLGAGAGVRVGLLSLFNDQNEEAKILANQLTLLDNYNQLHNTL